MTVIVKITSGENKADENVSKGFELIPIAAGMRAAFIRDDEGKGWLNVHGNDDHGEERLLVKLPILGNAYIMDGGKTVASFSSANIPDQPPLDADEFDDLLRNASVNQGNYSINRTGSVNVNGSVTIEGSMSSRTRDDITEITPEMQEGIATKSIDETAELIASIIADGEVVSGSDEDWFIRGLAAAIETYRGTSSKHRGVINLEYTGSSRFAREKLDKLQDTFRVTGIPISLRVNSDDNNYITDYTIEAYYNRCDVSEADMLLLRDLRNKQTGLVKNLIDKVIKYYKAGVSVVPLDPVTLITTTEREQIKHKLHNVLGVHFSFIVADKSEDGNSVSGDWNGQESALYTHVVIRFNRR